MKKYVVPEVEIFKLPQEDVVCVSNVGGEEDDEKNWTKFY